jgi:hypothetical protein
MELAYNKLGSFDIYLQFYSFQFTFSAYETNCWNWKHVGERKVEGRTKFKPSKLYSRIYYDLELKPSKFAFRKSETIIETIPNLFFRIRTKGLLNNQTRLVHFIEIKFETIEPFKIH